MTSPETAGRVARSRPHDHDIEAGRLCLRGRAVYDHRVIKRGGLCHCLVCRKAHAAVFNPFVVFDPDQVTVVGAPAAWTSSPGYRRFFCARCGSRVFASNGLDERVAEYELSLVSYDEVGWFQPQYESWIGRREPWLSELRVPQYARNREPQGCASDGRVPLRPRSEALRWRPTVLAPGRAWSDAAGPVARPRHRHSPR